MKYLVILKLIFDFNLSQVNKVKPRILDKINIKNMLNKGQNDEVEQIIEDFSQENFEENGKLNNKIFYTN
jgi:hypothetical protein